ncbi:MAG: alkaline phosphatase family protein [Bacteroidales bacterium]|nr:alkaline phosphatase family protein [Bacteroidales bacterium]
MRKSRIVIVALAVIVLAAVVLIAGLSRRENYVVLVSFDGFRWDYPALYETPSFDRLASEGVKASRLVPSFPTKTFPNHYTLATGLYPGHHGLVNNTFYAPDLDLMYRMGDRSAVENGDFYGGEPIWVTASKQGLVTGSFYWVGSEAPVKGIQPDYWKRFDDSVPFATRIDTVVKWLGYKKESRPRLVTLYYEEPDGVAHGAGPVSEATGEIVAHVDSLLGVLMTKLEALPIARRINLIVLSDHGMGQLSPEMYVNLGSIIPQEKIIMSLGGNPTYNIDLADDYIATALADLKAAEGVTAWHRDSVPERLHYRDHIRIPDIVVVADSGWSIGMRTDGSSYRGGTHGYDPANSDMHAIFYARGRAFKQGAVVEELHNVDICNIVAAVLGIRPEPNDGSRARAAVVFGKEKYIQSIMTSDPETR